VTNPSQRTRRAKDETQNPVFLETTGFSRIDCTVAGWYYGVTRLCGVGDKLNAIAGHSGDGYSTRFGSDSGSKSGDDFAPLGDGFIGNVRVDSSQPVVAVINLSGTPTLSSTYNAVD